MMAYSYGKVLLAPGQRIGYLAMPPTMPDREIMREAIEAVQRTTGFCFPNALLQHAISDLDRLSIDVDHLQQKRDRMVDALRQIGYEVYRPEGTFYLFPKTPIPDDVAFVNLLTDHRIFTTPGQLYETPGHFRICLTASDEMIERSFSGFAAAYEQALS